MWKTTGNNAENYGNADVQHGDGTGCGVRGHQGTVFGKAVEGAGHNVGEGGDYQQGEQPAKHQEHFGTGFAHVLFNELAHGLAVVFDRSIQGSEILYCTEENAADKNP